MEHFQILKERCTLKADWQLNILCFHEMIISRDSDINLDGDLNNIFPIFFTELKHFNTFEAKMFTLRR